MNHFIWHAASGSRNKNRPWFVTRELRKTNERGMHQVWAETKKGNLRTWPTMGEAQKVANQLNASEGVYDWLKEDELAWWREELQPPHGSSQIPSTVRKIMLSLIDEVQFYREDIS